VEPRRPSAHGDNCERAFNDLNLVAQAEAVPSLGALTEPQAIAVLGAAWRCAAPAVLRRLLHEQAGLPEKLRTADWPIGEIGISLCALRDEHGVVACHGPTVSDIGAALHALRDFGVPLDGPADADGRTLLVRAVFKSPSLVQLALDCGADSDATTHMGETPLYYAALASTGTGCMAALLDAGADIDEETDQGVTALMVAARTARRDMVEWLLDHGAHVDARTAKGDTVLIMASDGRNEWTRDFSEPLEATPMAPADEAATSQAAGSAPLPAPVPGDTCRGSVPSEPFAAGAEPVDTAVFCPPRVACNSVFLVQVYLYPPNAVTEVDARARQADESAERRGTYSLPLDLLPGTRVDLRLEMPALTVTEPDAVLVWRSRTTAAQFEVAVPADAAGDQVIGRVRIAVAGVPAGTLRFQVGLAAVGTSPSAVDAREIRARRYRRAFVSYCSKDRAEVLRRVQAFRIAGLTVFQDNLDLKPGERWEKGLYREIDICDVFLLFWSHAAADSEWVGKEIAYAVARKQGDEERPPDIQPVPIEGPPVVPPPDSLKKLHFNDALLAHIRAAETTPVS
jgi:hypothetical protein